MVSLNARYLAGEHEAVWAEISRGWAGYGETYALEVQRHYTIDRTDAEAVVVETFARVARNADRIIERLRETGYRFECESGRYGTAYAPLRPADLSEVTVFLDDTFGDHVLYDTDLSPLPPALRGFAALVGSLDLRQRHPFSPDPLLPDGSLNPEAFPDGLPNGLGSSWTDETREMMKGFSDSFATLIPQPSTEEIARRKEIAKQDRLPHPQADDRVLSRLGDWDPLQVDFDVFTQTLTDPEAGPFIENGLVWSAEIAASFEH